MTPTLSVAGLPFSLPPPLSPQPTAVNPATATSASRAVSRSVQSLPRICPSSDVVPRGLYPKIRQFDLTLAQAHVVLGQRRRSRTRGDHVGQLRPLQLGLEAGVVAG